MVAARNHVGGVYEVNVFNSGWGLSVGGHRVNHDGQTKETSKTWLLNKEKYEAFAKQLTGHVRAYGDPENTDTEDNVYAMYTLLNGFAMDKKVVLLEH